ncbi:MAG: DUF1634 domain-containing protein [Terriglobia bacterium]
MTLPPQRASQAISAVLRWGSYLSTAVLLLGVVWMLRAPDVPLRVGPAMPLRQLGRQLAAGNPYAVMQLGILLLLLTPLLRIVTAAVSFGLAGERRYALVSLVVLSLILLGLLGVG